jgi:polysaccharide transporter, PST family
MLEEKNLVKNFLLIGFSYASNILIPILLMPHFIKTLGIELFGIVALSQAFMLYLNILVEYHFNIITTKEISINRNDYVWLNKNFNTVFITRIILALVSFLILFVSVKFYPPFINNSNIVFLSFLLVLGQAVTPNWFFQGTENMKAIAILNFIFKLFFIFFAFYFIRNSKDAHLANFILGLTNFICGMVGVIYIYKKYSFKFIIPQIQDIFNELKIGRLIFISNMSVGIYVAVNPIILGIYSNATIIGQYSVAERILGALRSLLAIYSQITYPRIALIASENLKLISHFYKKIFGTFFLSLVLFCVLLYIWAKEVMFKIFNISNIEIIHNVRLLLGIAIVVCLNIPFYQRLLISNLYHIANYILIAGGIISIILNFLLVPYYGVIGSIGALYITEFFVTFTLFYYTLKHKLF